MSEEACPVCWLKSCACSSTEQISRLRASLSTAEKANTHLVAWRKLVSPALEELHVVWHQRPRGFEAAQAKADTLTGIVDRLRTLEDAAPAALKAELEPLRASLSTAEKESAALRLLLFLHHGCSGAALYGDDGEMQCHVCALDFRRMSPTEIEARWRDISLRALSRSNATDALKAPKASDMAYDSSALEKALGALRAWVAAYNNALQVDSERLSRTPRARETGLGYAPVYEAFRAARDLIGSVDHASGGAHVDVPKAPKNQSDPDPR